MNKKFSVADSLVFGLKTSFDNFKLFLLVTAATCLMYVLVAGFFLILAPFASLSIIKELNGFKKSFKQHEMQYNNAQQAQAPAAHTLLEEVEAESMTIISTIKSKIYALTTKLKNSFNKITSLIEWQFFIKLLVSLLILTWLWLGYTKITLELYDKHTSTVHTLFSCFSQVLTGFIATLLYITIVVIGLICFIVPGLIAFVRFGYYRHFIVDQHEGIISSLRKSLHATKGYTWDLLGLSCAMFVLPLALLPAILFVKNGVLLASTAVYRKIS